MMELQPERKIRQYKPLGQYRIVPHGWRHFALYEGEELVAVTVYMKGALEVMRRLHEPTLKE